MSVIIFATIGTVLSLYAIWVKHHAKDKTYKAACDLHANVSCTKAFTSPYGKTLGVHNAWWGIAFYISVIVLMLLQQERAVLLLAVLAGVKTVQLAYLSYVKMRNFCVVCTATYVVNLAILSLAIAF